MRTVNLSTTSATLQEILTFAEEEALIIKTVDGQEFMVAEIEGFEEEIQRVREHPEIRALLARRSEEPAKLSIDEVRKKLGLV